MTKPKTTTGILGRHKRRKKPAENLALYGAAFSGTAAGRQETVKWPQTLPEDASEPQRLRHARLMTLSVLDRTAPVLIDRDEVMAVLEIGPRILNRWIRDGWIEDMVPIGEQQLFCSLWVREIILLARRMGVTVDKALHRLFQVHAAITAERGDGHSEVAGTLCVDSFDVGAAE